MAENTRHIFTAPPGFEAIRDSEGRATGEIRPMADNSELMMDLPTATRDVSDEMGRALVNKYREIFPGGGFPSLAVAKALLAAATFVPIPVTAEDGWQDIRTAPEDQYVILCTTGGHVGEALMLRDEDTDEQKWTWAGGPVSKFHTPLGWMPMPAPMEDK